MKTEIETGIHPVESPNLEIEGTITVVLKSGKHFTYRIEKVKRGDLEGKVIASLLVGPDNNRSYKGFAFINGSYVNVWRKCKGEAFDKHALILQGHADEHVDQFLQSGKCQRCGRKLTTPESIKRGMGPDCAGKGL